MTSRSHPLLARIAGWRWAVPLLIVVGFGLSFAADTSPLLSGYTRFILVTIGINIILSTSLNLVNGYMGEFSVGHAGFMSVGAYTASVFTAIWFPGHTSLFFPAVLLGGMMAAFLGFWLALLSFKTRGDYLAIITLAFLMIVKSAFENIPYVNGARGLSGMHQLTSLPWTFFWVVVTVWVIRNLVYSRFGRAVTAIREDEIAAHAMGVRTREAKIVAFVVSSFFAGVAGGLFAHQLQFINPGSFDIVKSTGILVMVYLGGVGSLAGSIAGALIFTLLSEALRPLGTWRMVVMPLLLVLLMLFRQRGLLGLRELPWFLPFREWQHRRQ